MTTANAKSALRVPPLDPADFTPEQAELVGDWTHLLFSRVVVRHPHMYRVFVPFIRGVIAETSLPPRDREVIVLRMLALCGDTYELHHHEMIARNNVGVSQEDIEACKAGDGPGLSAFDKVLLRATEQLQRAQIVFDATWEQLGERYTEAQRMEVVFLAGCYVTMAMITKSFGMPVESEDADYAQIQSLRHYT